MKPLIKTNVLVWKNSCKRYIHLKVVDYVNKAIN